MKALTTILAILIAGEPGAQEIVPSDLQPGDAFGTTVAVQESRMLVTSANADTTEVDAGAVYVFHREGQRWFAESKLVPSFISESSAFGGALLLRSRRAIIGAHAEDEYRGAVYVFVQLHDNGVPTWIESVRLQASDAQAGASFGTSVAGDEQGNVLVVGATGFITGAGGPFEDYSGAAYVFARDDGGTPEDVSDDSWSEIAQLTSEHTGTFSNPVLFGNSLAIEGDTILVGSPGEPSTPLLGAVHVYRYHDGGTPGNPADDVIHRENTIVGKTDEPGIWFGSTLSFQEPWAIVGALGAGSGRGSAFLFRHVGAEWQQVSELKPHSPFTMYFGWSVAVRDGHAVVGTPFSSGQAGEALEYGLADGGTWEFRRALIPLGIKPGDFLGYSVAVGGGGVFVGAPGSSQFGVPNTGLLYGFAPNDASMEAQ